VKSEKSARSPSVFSTTSKIATTAGTSVESNLEAQVSQLSLGGELVETDEAGAERSRVRIAFLTEQVSHHPPVSAYYADCPARGISLSGVDQIAAKVSGTAVRVGPGELNKGIYISISAGPGKGETYHVTHPTASVNGLLRGSPYVAIEGTTMITCAGGADGSKLRAILEYKEEVRDFLFNTNVEPLTFA
jgi:oxysterol-binding protein-related protein 9/10/11